eukprot:m.152625 g.152625  ORF g.152625 m.152625 type:complete len:145 (+) comp9778_c1_seq3:722-1156(+)
MSASGQYIIASYPGVLIKSNNLGQSWFHINASGLPVAALSSISSIEMDSLGQYIYIGYNGGLALSYDYGLTFHTVTPPAKLVLGAVTPSGKYVVGSAVSAYSQGAAACNDIWLSTNYGLTWNMTLQANATTGCPINMLTYLSIM